MTSTTFGSISLTGYYMAAASSTVAKVKATLYISSTSQAAEEALDLMQELHTTYGCFELEVINVSLFPERARAEGIVMVPYLIIADDKTECKPIVGHFSEQRAKIEDALHLPRA